MLNEIRVIKSWILSVAKNKGFSFGLLMKWMKKCGSK
jgi:hypothetical protein